MNIFFIPIHRMQGLLFTLFLLAVLDSTAFGQASSHSLSASAPKFAQWRIACTYLNKGHNDGLADTRRIDSITIEKTDWIKRSVFAYSDGSSAEMWTSKDGDVSKSSVTGAINVRVSNSLKSDFPELAWVTSETFQEEKKVDGRNCLVFRADIYREQLENPGIFVTTKPEDRSSIFGVPVTATAYIDSETRLPFRVEIDGDIRNYTFGEAPVEMLTLPADFAAALSRVQQRVHSVVSSVSRP